MRLTTVQDSLIQTHTSTHNQLSPPQLQPQPAKCKWGDSWQWKVDGTQRWILRLRWVQLDRQVAWWVQSQVWISTREMSETSQWEGPLRETSRRLANSLITTQMSAFNCMDRVLTKFVSFLLEIWDLGDDISVSEVLSIHLNAAHQFFLGLQSNQ